MAEPRAGDLPIGACDVSKAGGARVPGTLECRRVVII